MAKIHLFLQDEQDLGYIKFRDGEPYYSYSEGEADVFSLDEAKKICHKFSNKYICVIETPKETSKNKIQIKYV